MTSENALIPCLSVLGLGSCFPDEKDAHELELTDAGIDASILPPMIRRRTSLATKMAVTALDRACINADVERDLPTIFSSSVGEMAVTDQLCRAIADSSYPLSPTLFHNSVHNTAAGYWSMSVKSMAPMQSMAGLEDSFAMGLLEAGCQLLNGAERVLLVSYDEAMPAQFLPDYQWQGCAIALVLGAGSDAKATLSMPYQSPEKSSLETPFSLANPVLAGLSLIKHLKAAKPDSREIVVSAGHPSWRVHLEMSA